MFILTVAPVVVITWLYFVRMADAQVPVSVPPQQQQQEKNSGVEVKNVEIPITSEIKAALLAANHDLFGSFDAPKRAACRCRLEPLDLEPYKTRRFNPPVAHHQWAAFMQQAMGRLSQEQYDVATQTLSWDTLVLFQEYLKTIHMPELPVGDLLRLVTNVTLGGLGPLGPLGRKNAPCDPPSQVT